MAVKLTIDFETRGTADLRTSGAAAYAAHPGTEVICLALKRHGEEPVIWYSPEFLDAVGQSLVYPEISGCVVSKEQVEAMIAEADTIEAHNAQFEWFIWKYVMPRYGFAPLDASKLRCSAAKAAVRGLPRDLDGACKVAGVAQQKDLDGAKLMQKICKPRPVRKGGVVQGRAWCGTPEDFVRLGLYCMQDVRAEETLSDALPDLIPAEQALWQLDLEINDRGVRVDVPSVNAIVDAISEHTERCESEFRGLTGLDSPRQREATLDLLQGMGADMDGLTKRDVSAALKTTDDGKTRRILELRQTLAMSSTAKYKAMLSAACPDNRIRGAFMYHGAGTGRWTGRLIQPQNFPRGAFQGAVVEEIIDTFNTAGLDGVRLIYGDPMTAASSCLRGMLIPSAGCDFVCADYSSVEGRVLAWLAGDSAALDVYRSGKDPYKVAASAIYGVPYEEVTKQQRQTGKVAELALGYQGSVGAFSAMAANYGLKLDDDMIRKIVKSWRDSRPVTTMFWRNLETAVRTAVTTGDRIMAVGRLKIGLRDGYLCMRLPSGRCLWWANPRMRREVTPYGEKDVVAVDGVDLVIRQWRTSYLYGGLLAENATQATARDLLREAMFNLDKAGYKIVLHIHDEIVAECPIGQGNVETYERLMCSQPEWADGIPLRAEGWRGPRYKK